MQGFFAITGAGVVKARSGRIKNAFKRIFSLRQAKKAAVKLGDFTALTLPTEGAYSIER
jgi:hypothetical protein